MLNKLFLISILILSYYFKSYPGVVHILIIIIYLYRWVLNSEAMEVSSGCQKYCKNMLIEQISILPLIADLSRYRKLLKSDQEYQLELVIISWTFMMVMIWFFMKIVTAPFQEIEKI